MIDPGHPFSKPYKEIIDALEQRIREGVEQPASQRFTFRSATTTYELAQLPLEITRVHGLAKQNFAEFHSNVDFQHANNRINWLEGGIHPDDGSRFEIEYVYREVPAGLTDFNPGSVIGTLVRAFAREMKLMYEQMDQAYRRAFIDQANNVALDNVVALLGMQRNPALKASGHVTFLRKSATKDTVRISAGTRVADESGRIYITTGEGAILAAHTELIQRTNGPALKVADKIAVLKGIWHENADPEAVLPFQSVDTNPDFPFGEDERTVTLAKLADDTYPSGILQIRYCPKSVTVPVEAVEPGLDSNVNAGAVVVMPTPPSGVDGVINELPVSGGILSEEDDRLRERARHALERAGNATLDAVKFAVLEVDGVEAVEVLDHDLDSSIPTGEIQVRFFSPKPEIVQDEVIDVVEQTRAAGIIAHVATITTVDISGTFVIIPEPDMPAAVPGQFLAEVTEAITALAIGQPLVIRKLNALAYASSGLAEVAEAHLAADRGEETVEISSDPFTVQKTELLRPAKDALHVALLKNLFVVNNGIDNDKNIFDLQLHDANGVAVKFNDFTLNIDIVVKARLVVAPDQPAQQIGQFASEIAFKKTTTARLTIGPGEREQIAFRPAEHELELDVLISASAYPGLEGAETTMEFPI
ncbi:MAG: baseplate J/gp47 family protein [bacterium]